MSEKCSEKIYRGFGYNSSNCTRTGKLEHKGRLYCAQHHPPTVGAKREVRHAKWDAQREEDRQARKRTQLEAKLLSQFSLAELENAVGVELIVPVL